MPTGTPLDAFIFLLYFISSSPNPIQPPHLCARGQKSEMSLTGPNLGCHQSYVLLGGSKGESFFFFNLPIQILEATHISWLVVPPYTVTASNDITPTSALSSYLPSPAPTLLSVIKTFVIIIFSPPRQSRIIFSSQDP